MSPLNWIGDFTLSLLLKLPPGKLQPWFVLWSYFFTFFSPFSLWIYHTVLIQCCCYVCTCANRRYLDILGKLQKLVCGTTGPSVSVSLEPMAFCLNLASKNLFCSYYFGRYLSELADLAPLHHSHGRWTRYSNSLPDFSITIPMSIALFFSYIKNEL